MKRYYYFVRNLNGFGSDDVVYKVAVGSSMREHAKVVLVSEFARDCGMYFQPVSDKSDRAISSLANSLFKGTSFALMYLRRANISISDLYQMIVDDSFTTFEKNLAEPTAKLRLLSLLSPSFFFINQPSKRITTCQPSRSKYLSHEKGSENTHVLISVCLILGLFMLAGYLEGLERCTF